MSSIFIDKAYFHREPWNIVIVIYPPYIVLRITGSSLVLKKLPVFNKSFGWYILLSLATSKRKILFIAQKIFCPGRLKGWLKSKLLAISFNLSTFLTYLWLSIQCQNMTIFRKRIEVWQNVKYRCHQYFLIRHHRLINRNDAFIVDKDGCLQYDRSRAIIRNAYLSFFHASGRDYSNAFHACSTNKRLREQFPFRISFIFLKYASQPVTLGSQRF